MNRSLFAITSALILGVLLPAQGQVEDLPLPQTLPPSSPAPSRTLGAPSRPVPLVPSKPTGVALSSTSASGQFIVYGPDLRVRSGIAGKCEEISQELTRLLRTPDPWVLTVVVQIKPLAPTDPPDLGITTQVSALAHGGFHLQLNLPERAGLRPADFRRELIRLLLTERVLRSHKRLANEDRARLVPPWVHTGVLKALDYRLRGRPSAEFAAIFKSGKVYGIEEILDAEPTGLDGLSRTIYETSCCALMLAVIDQPEGPLRFSRFLAALAQEEKPQRELLKQWFPGLAESDTRLNKWWSLQLASLATPSMSETLDPTQTVELLDRALTFLVPSVKDQKLPKPTVIASIASQRPAPLPKPQVEVAATPNVPEKKSPASVAKKTTSTKSSKPATKSVSSRPKDLPEAPVAVAEETEEAKQKRGFLRNFLPFGLGGSDKMAEDEASEESAKEETQAEPEVKSTKEEEAAAKAREKELKKAQEKEAKEKAAQEKAEKEAAEKEKAAAEKAEKEKQRMADAEPKKAEPSNVEESKDKPTPAEEPTGDAKGRRPSLNPFKWFRGGKGKPDEGAPVETPEKGKEEAALPISGDAEAWVWHSAASREARVVRDLLGNARGRFIQAPAKPGPAAPPVAPEPAAAPMREQADLLMLPVPTQPAIAATSGEVIAFPIEDYAVILAHPDKDRLLADARLSLQSLAIRGNALFREIAAEYQKVIADLGAGKTKDMDSRLKALRKRAVETYAQACAVQEHLDWFEATQSTRYSGLFEDFLTLPERVKEELPPRKDPISKYLDEVEAQLGR